MKAAEQSRKRGRPRALNPQSKAGSIQALDRGLALLRVVAEADGLTLTDLAQRTGIAPSTVHRLLFTLEAHRFVAHDEERGLWLIGVDAFQTGTAFLRNRRLAGMGRDTMRELMEQTGETINLGIEDDGEVVFISQVESHNTLRAFFRAGSRSLMHASGVGKALLAGMSEQRVKQILYSKGLLRFTEKTFVDPTALFAELQKSRQRGWAVDDEERTLGMRCVAAPIYNEMGETIAAVSMSGPAVRITLERLGEFGPTMMRAADQITESIGGIKPRRD
jgi:IclR family acetate operon transcriptional repressor